MMMNVNKGKKKISTAIRIRNGRAGRVLPIHVTESAEKSGLGRRKRPRPSPPGNEQTNPSGRIGRDLVLTRHAAGAGASAGASRTGARRAAQRCARIRAARARAGGATHHRRARAAPRGPRGGRDPCADVSYLRKRLSQFVGCTGFFLATM
ncbi:hypothetical protein Bsp3421_001421 [Burkholderia sp. FERM BP-3421]|jgi:hypothetical protein|uniref:hypothetical protein n=1 Tax=Burkholderia sp. FERM BP-3421 TaxID=1494466 RepID=UPI00235F59BF|nr:hypothetical protein [Burkholderia sp. FERM BP-3421]WDD91495.1 hypothetical protein Bsp3421_001421 [Burkholderia sp. FERM BP-3421]